MPFQRTTKVWINPECGKAWKLRHFRPMKGRRRSADVASMHRGAAALTAAL
eukprot:CAMPEP_0206136946 /NCGR_PEP_ID=MMETSP1473-20131121/2154_1 /ASSEMBLY_ACC=CAM_ASM_001109 /TAXON_ID=1461547 /ORGANISM="Stichococcus sp, Strain RCC1054" /LENGTH=50 /DNA_ID=CAMNT_0053529801 /DNA_START=72 /DNA_END=220 /DNA_ORIENTATION=+